jgi:hypothetical protein
MLASVLPEECIATHPSLREGWGPGTGRYLGGDLLFVGEPRLAEQRGKMNLR